MKNCAKTEHFSSRFFKGIRRGRNFVICGSSPDNFAFQIINNGTFLIISIALKN
jgi:hypothetical protein